MSQSMWYCGEWELGSPYSNLANLPVAMRIILFLKCFKYSQKLEKHLQDKVEILSYFGLKLFSALGFQLFIKMMN